MKNKKEAALIFLPLAANGKPQHLGSEKVGCPFCDYAEEDNILRKEGNQLWVLNKYQTLRDTFQTIIIEHPDHNKDISTYTIEENRKLFAFAFDSWAKTKEDPYSNPCSSIKITGPYLGELKAPSYANCRLKGNRWGSSDSIGEFRRYYRSVGKECRNQFLQYAGYGLFRD